MADSGKIIVATGFKKLPKVQYMAQSSHTASRSETRCQFDSNSVARKSVCLRFVAAFRLTNVRTILLVYIKTIVDRLGWKLMISKMLGISMS